MRILVINPVGTNRWDEKDKKICEEFASPNTQIDVISLSKGPLSVETPESEAQVIPLVIETAMKYYKEYDAIVVNCFLDPAVDLLKGIVKIPVVGPCEASLALASMIGKKIGVVTVSNKAIWMVEDRIEELAFKDKVIYVSGIPLGVLDLDEDIKQTKTLVIKEAENAIKNGTEVIVLGCTGLAGLAKEIQNTVKTPVIDPTGAAIKMAESLIKLNLYNARYGR
ncbi:MAG: aspartate/glutamate racemase family protein [Thermoprotei archaeon]|jgi:allantoin racemase